MRALAQFFLSDPVRTVECAMGVVTFALYMRSMYRALHVVRWSRAWCFNPVNRLTIGRIFAALTVLTFTVGVLHALITGWGTETTVRSMIWSLAFIWALARWAVVDRFEWRVL